MGLLCFYSFDNLLFIYFYKKNLFPQVLHYYVCSPKKENKMRNENLDKRLPIDEKIGELITEGDKQYRMIGGKKIYQIKEDTQRKKDTNLIINRVRASGMKPSEYFKMLFGE